MRSIFARHVNQSLGLVACLSVLAMGASASDPPEIRPVQSARVEESNYAASLIDSPNAAGIKRVPLDCDTNGTLDECDIAGNTSQDACSDGIPDESWPSCTDRLRCGADGNRPGQPPSPVVHLEAGFRYISDGAFGKIGPWQAFRVRAVK